MDHGIRSLKLDDREDEFDDMDELNGDTTLDNRLLCFNSLTTQAAKNNYYYDKHFKLLSKLDFNTHIIESSLSFEGSPPRHIITKEYSRIPDHYGVAVRRDQKDWGHELQIFSQLHAARIPQGKIYKYADANGSECSSAFLRFHNDAEKLKEGLTSSQVVNEIRHEEDTDYIDAVKMRNANRDAEAVLLYVDLEGCTISTEQARMKHDSFEDGLKEVAAATDPKTFMFKTVVWVSLADFTIDHQLSAEFSFVNCYHNYIQMRMHSHPDWNMDSITHYEGLSERPFLINHLFTKPDGSYDYTLQDEKTGIWNIPYPTSLFPLEGVVVKSSKLHVSLEVSMPQSLARQWFSHTRMKQEVPMVKTKPLTNEQLSRMDIREAMLLLKLHLISQVENYVQLPYQPKLVIRASGSRLVQERVDACLERFSLQNYLGSDSIRSVICRMQNLPFLNIRARIDTIQRQFLINAKQVCTQIETWFPRELQVFIMQNNSRFTEETLEHFVDLALSEEILPQYVSRLDLQDIQCVTPRLIAYPLYRFFEKHTDMRVARILLDAIQKLEYKKTTHVDTTDKITAFPATTAGRFYYRKCLKQVDMNLVNVHGKDKIDTEVKGEHLREDVQKISTWLREYNKSFKQTSKKKLVNFPTLDDQQLHPQANDNRLPLKELKRAEACLDSLRLNQSQRHAILNALSCSVSLIQGPPGTGKTSTIVALVRIWTRVLGNDFGSTTTQPQKRDKEQDNCIFKSEDFANSSERTVQNEVDLAATGKQTSADDFGDEDAAILERGEGRGGHVPSYLSVSGRGPVLVTAHTNVAVDEICHRLLMENVNEVSEYPMRPLQIVRLGDPSRIHDRVKEVMLPSIVKTRFPEAAKIINDHEALVEVIDKHERLALALRGVYSQMRRHNMDNMYVDEMAQLHRQQYIWLDICNITSLTGLVHISQLLDVIQDQVAKNRDLIRQERVLAKQISRVTHKYNEIVLKEADVICCTCDSSGSELLKAVYFSLIVMDECSQISELTSLVPLSHLPPTFPAEFTDVIDQEWQEQKDKVDKGIVLDNREMRKYKDYHFHGAKRSINSFARVVMVGDQCQLPPFCTEFMKLTGLHISLFERLITKSVGDIHVPELRYLQDAGTRNANEWLYPLVSMLDTQFRMHPRMTGWISDNIYNGLLKNGTNPVFRKLIPGIPWPFRVDNSGGVAYPEFNLLSMMIKKNTQAKCKDMLNICRFQAFRHYPIIFIHHEFPEQRDAGTTSIFNPGEIDIIIKILDHILGKTISTTVGNTNSLPLNAKVASLWTQLATLKHSGINMCSNEVGVVTPYDLQAQKIKARLNSSIEVEVKTVDGFQGREKGLIIMSLVRNNANGRTGFLKDPRRLNVALTRAKRGLILVGNKNTLKNDTNWGGYISILDKHNAVIRWNDFKEAISRDTVPYHFYGN